MALRNDPRISQKTREKIHKLAVKHGYTRDPVVSSLMNRLRSHGGRSRDKVGVLTWWNTPNGERSNSLGLQSHEGICRRANRLGYEVEFFWAKEPGMTAKRLSSILKTRSIRGIILATMARARGHVSLDWSNFAVAALGYSILKPAMHRASYSHYQGMVITLRSLRSRGYRRIGFANLIAQEDMANDAWLSAYLGYHYRIQDRIPLPPLLLPAWKSGVFADWIKNNQPDVVISNNTEPLLFLEAMGYRVPEDIGFASLDWMSEGLSYAGLAQPRDLVAANAVDLVVEQLENNECGLPKSPKIVLVEGFWKNGPTVKDRKKLS